MHYYIYNSGHRRKKIKTQDLIVVEHESPIDGNRYEEITEEEYNSIIEFQKRYDEIAALKRELENTDYQIIKCAERYLASAQVNIELPYDIETLNDERQTKRDRINELEVELKNCNV